MVKLKHLKAYETKDCPDHIIEEVQALMDKMLYIVAPLMTEISPNIALSAFNRVHAALIVTMISDNPEEIKNAACCEAAGLIGNIEDISKVKIFDEERHK
jgi:hypothetical protein